MCLVCLSVVFMSSCTIYFGMHFTQVVKHVEIHYSFRAFTLCDIFFFEKMNYMYLNFSMWSVYGPGEWPWTRSGNKVHGTYHLRIRHMSLHMTKPTKWPVRPVKTHISMGIRPVWSESSLCAQWVAMDPSFLHTNSEDSDQQTGQMPSRLGRCPGWS